MINFIEKKLKGHKMIYLEECHVELINYIGKKVTELEKDYLILRAPKKIKNRRKNAKIC